MVVKRRVHRVKVMAHPIGNDNEKHWDTPGLEPRHDEQRCANHHGMCAYRDDDPERCPLCHRPWAMTSPACRNEDDHEIARKIKPRKRDRDERKSV